MELRVLRLSSIRLPLLGLVTVVSLLAAGCGDGGPVNIVQVKGDSMMPTITDGERLLVDRRAFANSLPQRSDIVLYRRNDVEIVRRVVGLPGETIVIKEGSVYVNGSRLDEPYLAPGTLTESDVSSFQVPEEAYFVLADTRSNRNDSRLTGFVKRSDITGKVSR